MHDVHPDNAPTLPNTGAVHEHSLHLRIVVPGRIFLDQPGVLSLTVATTRGIFGIRPRRLDCVMSLTPGLATYETIDSKRVTIAIDEGILVKTGGEITLSVRHVVTGTIPGDLKQTFEAELKAASEREKDVRLALARLESAFIRRLSETGRQGP